MLPWLPTVPSTRTPGATGRALAHARHRPDGRSRWAAAYFRTQVLKNQDYSLRSDDNRLRVIPVPAPRGAIYDRNGKLIAETVTTYSLYLEPAARRHRRARRWPRCRRRWRCSDSTLAG